ncbi:MAG: proline racemase family protein [Synergistes sp.]|nr:proline racemase family protein [Synergistes sp.]
MTEDFNLPKIGNRFAVTCIETHTEGEPTRTILSDFPKIPGHTMEEKMLYMMRHHDHLRKGICFEPRGNDVMSGTIVTEPCDPRADFGVLYYEVGGWMPMCGHDTIGVSTALIESGLLKAVEPYTYATLDTPSGLVKVKIEVKDGVAKSVTFKNAPAFVMNRGVTVKVPDYGDITLDIAYGGNVFAVLPAAAMGLTLEMKNSKEIVAKGSYLRRFINEQIKIKHPYLKTINKVTHIQFYQGGDRELGADIKNAVVIPPAAIDRSPCGTGTSARLALLHAEGKLAVGEEFVHESLIGSLFFCKIIEETEVCGIPAVVPEIRGRAWVIGKSTILFDPEDPFIEGFLL